MLISKLLGRTTTILNPKRERRLRAALIEKVRVIWIDGLLVNSLQDSIWKIELGFEEVPEAVKQPPAMTLERSNQPPQYLPSGTSIYSVYRDGGGSLLILGEPGSGKTMTLLELADYLLIVAEDEPREPIPIVFNLSSWAHETKPLADWLVDELNILYQVNRKLARSWLAETPFPFVLLLDGLDEVKFEHRADCINAINTFSREYGPINLVVCSRTEDYRLTANQLHSLRAITLQPLTQTQINDYLSAGRTALEAAHQAVKVNNWLQELATTPLFLNVIALVYQNRSQANPSVSSTEQDQKQLWNNYLEWVFGRRFSQAPYSKQQAIQWLSYLAAQMTERSQTVFFVEHLQPDWLKGDKQRRSYKLIANLTYGLIFALIATLIGGLIGPCVDWLLGGLIGSLLGGLLVGLTGKPDGGVIKLYERLAFSGKGLIGGLIFALITGLIFAIVSSLGFGLIAALLGILIGGQISALTNGLIGGLTFGLFFGLIAGLVVGLIWGLNITLSGGEIERRITANQGVWQSGKNSSALDSSARLLLG